MHIAGIFENGVKNFGNNSKRGRIFKEKEETFDHTKQIQYSRDKKNQKKVQ